jgi:hypothetical protein
MARQNNLSQASYPVSPASPGVIRPSVRLTLVPPPPAHQHSGALFSSFFFTYLLLVAGCSFWSNFGTYRDSWVRSHGRAVNAFVQKKLAQTPGGLATERPIDQEGLSYLYLFKLEIAGRPTPATLYVTQAVWEKVQQNELIRVRVAPDLQWVVAEDSMTSPYHHKTLQLGLRQLLGLALAAALVTGMVKARGKSYNQL